MEQLARLIFDRVATGKLDQETALDLLAALKREPAKGQTDIAVIGVSVNLPGARSLEALWRNIRNKREFIREYPAARQNDVKGFISSFTHVPEADIRFSSGGYLDDVDGFDYGFFQLSPKEAAYMDPNQRLFVEACWEAIEDAGYGGSRLSGSKTGVYVGYADWPVYGQYISKHHAGELHTASVGNTPSIIASRISYLLDLKGPAYLVDTACSSSLVAVHQACKAIAGGECDQALAGGVKVCLMPVDGVFDIGIESSNRQTSTFDDSSDGTVWGEGTVALLLKPLAVARRDGDQIYAVIKGTAINQDGASAGLTAPNAAAQEQVLAQAWEEAGIAPDTITYFEAHGTGTKLGDPIEIDGIQRAFRRYTAKKQFCAIGSVKTNIGHLDGASGIAGLAKAIAALKYKELPPTLHFGRPNRKIAFEQSPVYVNDRTVPWVSEGAPRRCGVSSFGFSGTNCHLVLEEAPSPGRSSDHPADAGVHLLALSAKSKRALEALVRRYADELPVSPHRLADICYTAGAGRGHYGFRLAVTAAGRSEAAVKLRTALRAGLDQPVEGVFYGEHRVVAAFRDNRPPGERTAAEMRALSGEASALISSGASAGEEPGVGMAQELGRLYVQGAEIDWDAWYSDASRRRVSVPVYPFQRTRCWIDMRPPEPVLRSAAEASVSASGLGPTEALADDAASLPQVRLCGRADGGYSKPEQTLADVWGMLLGVEELGVDDDFFELGGNSILTIRMEVELERRGWKLPSEEVYRLRSVQQAAPHLTATEAAEPANAGENAARVEIAASGSPVNRQGDNPRAEADEPSRSQVGEGEETRPAAGQVIPAEAAAETSQAPENANPAARSGLPIEVILPDIEPFNEVFYKNCFYNSMFPIAISHGESILPFLLNDLILFDEQDGTGHERFGIQYEPVHPLRHIFSQANLQVEALRGSEDIVWEIRNHLSAGRPIVVWVDSYYESIRKDAYFKEHFDHTLLIYGYNDGSQHFYIVEHDRRENLSYRCCTIPYTDVALGFQGFAERFLGQGDHEVTHYVFEHDAVKAAQGAENSSPLHGANQADEEAPFKSPFADHVAAAGQRLQSSRDVLERFIASFAAMTASAEALQTHISYLVGFLTETINAKQVELYRLTRLLGEQSEAAASVSRMIGHWDTVRKTAVRFMYLPVYKAEAFDASLARLTEAAAEEQRFELLLLSELDGREHRS